MFSDFVVASKAEIELAHATTTQAILLRRGEVELSLPADYSVADFITVIMAIEKRS